MKSFTKKELRVTLIMAGTGSVFPGSNDNTLTLTGLRVSAKVQQVARLATHADIEIYGMLAEDMNALTVAWANPPVVLDHIVILEANDGNGWVQVFSGTVTEAQPEYRAAPAVYFRVSAMCGYFQKINVAEPTSYSEQVDIGAVVTDLAAKMGFVYEDGGADGVMNSPYFAGTLWDQLVSACEAANADFYITGKTILVTKAGLPRDKAPALVLNARSGLIGYPMYERAGLNVACIFNPALACGVPLDLESDVPNATGRWYPFAMLHELESVTPKGAWASYLQCLRVLV